MVEHLAHGVWVAEISFGISGNEGGKGLCGEPAVSSFGPISLIPDFLGSRLQKSLSLYTLFILCILSLPTQQLLFCPPPSSYSVLKVDLSLQKDSWYAVSCHLEHDLSLSIIPTWTQVIPILS